MKIKQLVVAGTLAALPLSTLAAFDAWWRVSDAKYRPGDCITPTDQSISFYGHYARVAGVVDFDTTQEPGVYVLYFPVYVPRTPFYTQNLDETTHQVADEFCDLPRAQ